MDYVNLGEHIGEIFLGLLLLGVGIYEGWKLREKRRKSH